MKKRAITIISIISICIFALLFLALIIGASIKHSNKKMDFVSIDSLTKEEAVEEQNDSFSDDLASEEIKDGDKFVFNLNDIPLYNDNSFVVLNENNPLFSKDQINTEVFEEYSELDDLGRCGEAFANLCPELMPDEERGEIGYVKPSGWQTVKYNDLIEGNYLYNRCHLIGYQLAGENDNICNLITGTRYLNTIGMLPFENEVAAYIYETGNHVLYRVTPIYQGDNLVASGVTMEAYSVEDDGVGICFYVYVYNVQPGIIIDYAFGESELDPNYVVIENEIVEEESSDMQEDESYNTEINDGVQNDDATISGNDSFVSDIEVKYVVNINSGKFHIPTCDSVAEMKEKNKKYTDESREELIEQGYSPCKACNP